MENNLLIAQSGGPTAAINASLSGAVQAAFACGKIDTVYGGFEGISGILEERICEIGSQLRTPEDYRLLECTPSMALGSCRRPFPDPDGPDALYRRLFGIFRKYHIRYFMYIGGNDSMDTVDKLNRYCRRVGADLTVVGVPKTVDNDMALCDHTPGYGSAVKFVATSVAEIVRDSSVYGQPSVTIIELMGRSTGWLTAAAALPRLMGLDAPDLYYLPEVPFSPRQFLQDIRELHAHKRNVVVAVAEGVRTSSGKYAGGEEQSGETDGFGNRYLSGVGRALEKLVRQKLGCKVRSVELSVLQRCASHLLSATDVGEARTVGAQAVTALVNGQGGAVPVLVRADGLYYGTTVKFVDAGDLVGQVRAVPEQWISPSHNNVTDDLLRYMLPLIAGDVIIPKRDGLPVHFKFRTSFPCQVSD